MTSSTNRHIIIAGSVARPESSTGVFLWPRRGRVDHNTPILGVPPGASTVERFAEQYSGQAKVSSQ